MLFRGAVFECARTRRHGAVELLHETLAQWSCLVVGFVVDANCHDGTPIPAAAVTLRQWAGKATGGHFESMDYWTLRSSSRRAVGPLGEAEEGACEHAPQYTHSHY